MTGANVMMMYTGTILRQAKSSLDSRWGTVYIGFAQLAGFCIAIPLIDKLGRKILIAVSTIVVGSSMIVLGSYFLATEVSINIIFKFLYNNKSKIQIFCNFLLTQQIKLY